MRISVCGTVSAILADRVKDQRDRAKVGQLARTGLVYRQIPDKIGRLSAMTSKKVITFYNNTDS